MLITILKTLFRRDLERLRDEIDAYTDESTLWYIRSIAHIAQLQHVKDNDEDFVSAHDMLKDLEAENRKMAKHMREAHKIADDAEDVATASLLEVYIDETERRTWFLFETTRD